MPSVAAPRSASLLVLAAAAAVLTACGSSSASSSGGSSSPAASPTSSSSAVGAPAQATTTAAAAAAKSSASAPAGRIDSCTVVTSAEAAAALHQPVSAGVLGHATVEGGLACVFYGPAAPSARTPDVAQPDTVRVVVVEGADARRWYEDYRSKVRAQPVSGFGDQAYYDGYASLSVLTGNYYLRVAVAPADAAPSLADEKTLAAAILPRL